MKKVKIMLTAITVFAIVGGALAFKAKKFGAIIYTTTFAFNGATCPLPKANFTTTLVPDPLLPNPISATITQGKPCVQALTVTLQ